MLLYLPLAHNFGRLMHLASPYVGYTTAFLPDPLQTAEALTTTRPDRAPERATGLREDPHGDRQRDRRDDGRKAPPRRLVARRSGERSAAREAAGLPVAGALALKLRVADKLVFTKIRARLGGRLRTPISGGAPLSKEIEEFFDAIGIRILEAYGLTECTTGARRTRRRTGASAPSARRSPVSSSALAEDGELLVRSETVFAGYYKEPEATAEVLDADGWLARATSPRSTPTGS